MDSPLAVLHKHVGTLIGNTDTRSPLLAKRNTFDFLAPFPSGPTYKTCKSFLVQIEVRWFPETNVVGIEAQLKMIKRDSIKNLPEFLDTVTAELKIFLHAVYANSAKDGLPSGCFHAKQMHPDKYISPAVIAGFTFDLGKEDKLLPEFNLHFQYVLHAAWLAASVLNFVAEEKREPNAAERFRILSVAHGTAEVLRFDERKEGAPPPVIHIPSGFYGTDERQLRPQ